MLPDCPLCQATREQLAAKQEELAAVQGELAQKQKQLADKERECLAHLKMLALMEA